MISFLDDTIHSQYLSTDAAFGPTLPSNGLEGRLLEAKPSIYACSSIWSNLTTGIDNPIILVSRSPDGGCTFEEKVRVVEAAGGVGAVIYDYENEGLLTMGPDGGSSPSIPSIFVSKASGDSILSELGEYGDVNGTVGSLLEGDGGSDSNDDDLLQIPSLGFSFLILY